MKYLTTIAALFTLGFFAGEGQAQWSSSSSSQIRTRSRSVEQFRSSSAVQPSVKVVQPAVIHQPAIQREVRTIQVPVTRTEMVEVERQVPVTTFQTVKVQEQRQVTEMQERQVVVEKQVASFAEVASVKSFSSAKAVKSSSYNSYPQRQGLLGRLRGGRGGW